VKTDDGFAKASRAEDVRNSAVGGETILPIQEKRPGFREKEKGSSSKTGGEEKRQAFTLFETRVAKKNCPKCLAPESKRLTQKP